jgi:hypothetical protein
MKRFNEEELSKIGHTLGINVYHAKLSKRKEDKILLDEFYRNYYNYGRVGEEDKEPEWITNLGEFIDKWTQSGLYYFCINELGIKIFREQFKKDITDKYIPLSRSKQRYQDYLHADLGCSFSQYLGIKK